MKKETNAAPKEKKDQKLTPEQEKAKDKRFHEKIAMMRHKDLQTACIKRGMPFKEVIESSHHDLHNFFYKHFDDEDLLDDHILDEFDEFIENELQKRGHKKGDAILSPSLRLGFAPDPSLIEKSNKLITVAYKEKDVPKEVKPKRQLDEELGVMKGTKKALTYELTKKGLSIDKIISKVKKAFPEAKEKSITIWHKRCIKGE